MVICPTWPLNALHSIRPVYLCDFDLIFVVFHCILCLQYAASYRLKFSGKLKLVQDKFQKVMQIISTEQVVSSTAWQNMYFLDCLYLLVCMSLLEVSETWISLLNQFPWGEADVWCLRPAWHLRTVIWFHFTMSSFVLLPAPIALSVLSSFLPTGPFS